MLKKRFRGLPPFAGRALAMLMVYMMQFAAVPLAAIAAKADATQGVMTWTVAGGDPRVTGGVKDRQAYQDHIKSQKTTEDMDFYKIPPHVRELFKKLAASGQWGTHVQLGHGENGHLNEIRIANGTILEGGLTFSADGKKSTRHKVKCNWVDKNTRKPIPSLKVYEAVVYDRYRVKWVWWVFEVCANTTYLRRQLPPRPTTPTTPEETVGVPEEELYAYYYEELPVVITPIKRAKRGEVKHRGILPQLVDGIFRYLSRTVVRNNITGGTFNGGSPTMNGGSVVGGTMNGGVVNNSNSQSQGQQQQSVNTNQQQQVDTDVTVINTGDNSNVSGSGAGAGDQGSETNQDQDQ